MSHYKNFKTVLYCTAQSMESIGKEELQKQIDFFHEYVGVDKVYLELYRDNCLLKRSQFQMCKKAFEENGIEVSGGMATTIFGMEDSKKRQRFSGTYCYSSEPMRRHLKETVEYIASQCDEFIIDDFYFTHCTCEDCLKEKGSRSWEDYRTEKMLEVSKNLIMEPARKVNPKIRVIIKYPNWRESYQETGYCPGEQKNLFDEIYTGTETRHPVHTDQHLPRYLSYSLMRFMENTAPGKNGGGWFDPYQCYPIDMYLEQMYLTAFSKPREIMMFCWGSLYKNKVVTPVKLQLSELDTVLNELGRCTGIPVYLPHRSQGEDHLEDYLGMAGIAFDPTPVFPENARRLFLTQAAHRDPHIMEKLERYVRNGGKAVITSGFMIEALGKGMEQMTSVRYRGRRFSAEDYNVKGIDSFFSSFIHGEKPIMFPLLEHRNNASWSLINGTNGDLSASILIRDTYGRGQTVCLAVPDCYSDIKHLPPEVLTRIRYEFCSDIYLDAPAQHSIFTYDNDTFGIYSYIADGCRPKLGKMRINGKVTSILPLDSNGKMFAKMMGTPIKPLFTTENESVFEIPMQPGEFAFYRIIRDTESSDKPDESKENAWSAPHIFKE